MVVTQTGQFKLCGQRNSHGYLIREVNDKETAIRKEKGLHAREVVNAKALRWEQA